MHETYLDTYVCKKSSYFFPRDQRINRGNFLLPLHRKFPRVLTLGIKEFELLKRVINAILRPC